MKLSNITKKKGLYAHMRNDADAFINKPRSTIQQNWNGDTFLAFNPRHDKKIKWKHRKKLFVRVLIASHCGNTDLSESLLFCAKL